SWTFEPVDETTFPAISLARSAHREGHGAMAAYNAANEEAVAAFLSGALPFLGIVDLLSAVLEDPARPRPAASAGVDGVLAVEDLLPATLFGVRVTQYMIGFGPTVWSRGRGETEYGLKAIPLGGYIRMIGMFPPHRGEPAGAIREDSTGFVQQMSQEAKEYESAQYGQEDAHRTLVAL